MRIDAFVAGLVVFVVLTSRADAEPACGTPATTSSATGAIAPAKATSPVAMARDLLARAKLLDETAASDERAASELAKRLPTLRETAKTARARADRASGDDRETLVARAEDLEADVQVSEVEVTSRKQSALDHRKMARDLREQAVGLVRASPKQQLATTACDPPFRYTLDGRKIYRVECL